MWYLIIGFIYAVASCLKYFTAISNLNKTEKLFASLEGHTHWLNYVVIFISRLLLWPAYIIMGIVN